MSINKNLEFQNWSKLQPFLSETNLPKIKIRATARIESKVTPSSQTLLRVEFFLVSLEEDTINEILQLNKSRQTNLQPRTPSDPQTKHLRSVGPALRRDRLWENTCFECFFGFTGHNGYWELNAAPDGDWNLYQFKNYRQGMIPELRVEEICLASSFSSAEDFDKNIQTDRVFHLNIGVPLQKILADLQNVNSHELDVSLNVVVKLRSSLTYWALQHCEQKPDFHLRKNFVLRLGLPKHDSH